MTEKTLPVILDIEASGFSSLSYPIEVGVVTSDGGLFCSLIQPLNTWTHWDESAERIHKIQRQQLVRSGKPARWVCQSLNDRLSGQTVYSDAWVWDSQWLNKLYGDAGMHKLFQLSPIESIACEAQLEIWDAHKASIIASTALVRHRASSDAKIIQQTFTQTQDQLNAGRDNKSVTG